MKLFVLAVALIVSMSVKQLLAQSTQKSSSAPAVTVGKAQPAANTVDYSGMYTFLKDGEFLQLSVEEDGSVTGFISRYGNEASDSGAFLNQFFRKAKLDGQKLEFTTQTVHAMWFEFSGQLQHVAGKGANDEGSRIIHGTLTQYTTASGGKQTSKTREVIFKSFPADVDSNDSQ